MYKLAVQSMPTMMKKRAAFHCMVLVAVLLVLLATIQGGIRKKLSLDLSATLNLAPPPLELYQILNISTISKEEWKLHTFSTGSIQEKCNNDIFQAEIKASATIDGLEALLTRLLVDLTSSCNQIAATGVTNSEINQLLCLVGRYKPLKPCYSFSFGLNGSSEVNRELASSQGCLVLAFDPSMKPGSHMIQERLLVFKEGLSGTVQSGTDGSPSFDTYKGYLERLKADKTVIDVLTIEVTSMDWTGLETAARDGSLQNVKQLVLRLKRNPTLVDSESQLRMRVATLRNIHSLGFRRWSPTIIAASQLESVNLSYINVNFINHKTDNKNPPSSHIALPLSTLSISTGPHFTQLETIRKANLSAMSAVELDNLYFNLVEQQHLYCPNSLRIGDADDGGWDVCFSEPFGISKSKPCVAFSFGINNVWRYDDELADVYHCRVYMFDPSMTNVKDHQRRKTSWFYRTGLSSNNTVQSNGWKMRTLCTLFDELGHSEGAIDILKIDIEYWEWVTFETALREGCLKRVKQFMFETHTTGLYRKPSDYARFIRILMGVFDLGFRSWKWHRNPYSVFYKSDSGLTRACCYEHYLINTHFIKSTVP